MIRIEQHSLKNPTTESLVHSAQYSSNDISDGSMTEQTPENLNQLTRDFFSNPMVLIEHEIQTLEDALEHFDYSLLRNTKSTNGVTSYGSDSSIVCKLFDMFSEKFLYSPNKTVKTFFRSLEKQNPVEQTNIIRLANLLLRFRNHIEEAEILYFQLQKNAVSDLWHLELSSKDDSSYSLNMDVVPEILSQALLAKNSSWVLRFHFLIEQNLQVLPIENAFKRYHAFIKCLQQLNEKCYQWLAENVVEIASQYEILKAHDFQPKKEDSKHKLPSIRRALFQDFTNSRKNDSDEMSAKNDQVSISRMKKP